MNIRKTLIRSALALSLGFCVILPLIRAAQPESSTAIPSIVQAGFVSYASGGPDPALSIWRKGGPLETDKKAAVQADDFKQAERSFGNYKSYEVIESKEVGKTSKIVYLSMNFERGAAYLSFHVYRTSKDWVVQGMEFNTKPELIMPWLILNSGK
jgi:hypothetical protein